MLTEQINQAYIQAMKARDGVRSLTLSLVRAQIKNVMIDRRVDQLADEEVIAIIKKQVKQRQDSIQQYTDGGRPELAAKEEQEMRILEEYLPAQLTTEQLAPIVAAAIQELGASSMKDMGRVIKLVIDKVAGQADNQQISAQVKQALSA